MQKKKKKKWKKKKKMQKTKNKKSWEIWPGKLQDFCSQKDVHSIVYIRVFQREREGFKVKIIKITATRQTTNAQTMPEWKLNEFFQLLKVEVAAH